MTLPTEPGVYIEANNRSPLFSGIWYLTEDQRWFSAAGSKYDGRAAEFAPLRKLVEQGSEREQARRDLLIALNPGDWSYFGYERVKQVINHTLGVDRG